LTWNPEGSKNVTEVMGNERRAGKFFARRARHRAGLVEMKRGSLSARGG